MPEGTTTDKILEQTFVELHKRTSHAAQRLADANDNVSEQTKLMFLEEKIKVGTREASAMQRMDEHKLAGLIAQLKSAHGTGPFGPVDQGGGGGPN